MHDSKLTNWSTKQTQNSWEIVFDNQKCPDCITPQGTRCESEPGSCPYKNKEVSNESNK